MDDPIRIYNVACSVLVAFVGLPQLRGFLTRGGKEQLHWQSSILLNLTAFWGSIESLRAGYPGGVRVYLLAVALTWLLAAVAYKPIVRWQSRRHNHHEETP